MHRIPPRFAVGAALALTTMLGACHDSTTPRTASLTVLLTDAPFPYDSVARVDMFVIRIDARMSAASNADAQDGIGAENDQPGAQHNGWMTIATPYEAYNLLDLQNGTTANLGQLTLPTATYRSFRLILDTDHSSITLKNGQVLDGSSIPGIAFPSAGRTGIKVDLSEPFSLTTDGTVMVLDFDVARSFVQRGNSIAQNGLLFTPVIRAVARDITGSLRGFVRGESADGEAVPHATVQVLEPGTPLGDTDPANVVATTTTDATGAFVAPWLLPGTYTLRAIPPSGSAYGPALAVGTVVVTTGATPTDVGVIVVPKK